MNGSQTSKIGSPRKKFSVVIVLAATLVLMGAKWAEKPIDNLTAVAGTWSGTGSHPRGARYTIKYWFKEDGSFKYS